MIAHHTRGTDAGFNGWDLILDGGHVEQRLYRVWPRNAMGVRTVKPIPQDQLHTLSASYDASDKASGLKLFLNGEELETEILRDKKLKSANVLVQHGGKFALGTRFRDRGFAGALVDDLKIHSRALTGIELAHLSGRLDLANALGEGKVTNALSEYYLSSSNDEYRKAIAVRHSAVKDMVMAEEAIHEIPVMEELEEPLPAYVLARGEYDAPKTEDVRAFRTGFEHILPRFDDDFSKDRRGLAAWSTHPDHPLTARVFVNRIWQQFFGTGLVDTPENFGFQGSLPSHPALLDWLARDFVSSGWDVKALCKKIVLSATFNQDSATRPELAQTDPENILLARGPAFRLSAEEIRDLALYASGLMQTAMGGPPVSPYQPGEDLWRESNGMSPPYKQDVGEALHRRSLYSVWKRTAPLPNMMAFDATTREVCAVARSRTNTPLQALVLLNDVQFVEAARALAAKSISSSDDDAEQVNHAFLSLTGRQADKREKSVLLDLYEKQIAHYEGEPGEAEALISQGDSPAPETIEPARLAAMTTVCQAVLNLDATIYRR